MSERYSRVFSLLPNLYTEGAPIVIAAGALLKDTVTGKVLAQLKIQNIGDKTIKAATVKLFPKDIMGNPLGECVEYQYLDIVANRDDDFGEQTPIFFSDEKIRGYDVAVSCVIFDDNCQWVSDEMHWEALVEQDTIVSALDDEGLVKEYQERFGAECKYGVSEQKDLWLCSCGHINRKEEHRCHYCGNELECFLSLDIAELNARRDEHLAERNQKIKKVKILAVAVGCLVAFVGVVVFTWYTMTVIIPKNNYADAFQLYERGKYSEAAEAFEALGDYSNSTDMVKESKYQYACQLLQKGKYDAAEREFRSVINYSNSRDMLTEVQYQKAKSLLENGDYDAAYKLFSGIEAYGNSQTMMKECKYQKALELYDQGKKEDAYTICKELNGYSNSGKIIYEMDYSKAVNLLSNKNYAEAYRLFFSMGSYGNATAKTQECINAWVDSILANTDVEEATTFKNAIGTLDASYRTSVYQKIKNKIDQKTKFDYWNGTDLAKTVYAIAQTIPDDYNKYSYSEPDFASLKKLLSACARGAINPYYYGDDYFNENRALLKEFEDIDFVLDYFGNNYIVETFLEGYWTNYSYYFKMDDEHSTTFNLPRVDKPSGTKYYDINKYIYVWEDGNDKELAKVFKFTIVNYDTIKVYCYKNSQTYTLYRD